MGKSRIVVVMSGCLFLSSFSFGMYNPEVGRFMQHDPHGINPAGGKNNAFYFENQYADGVNIYQYVYSNPLHGGDAYGLYETHRCRLSACQLYGCNEKCGPDITQAFHNAFQELEQELETEFKDPDIKKRVCGFSGIYHSMGWDFQDAWDGIVEREKGFRYPSVPLCKNTVTFEGHCVNIWELNYYLWGFLNHKCGHSEGEAYRWAAVWSSFRNDSRGCKLLFTTSGYRGKIEPLSSSNCDMSSCCSITNVPPYRNPKLDIRIRGR